MGTYWPLYLKRNHFFMDHKPAVNFCLVILRFYIILPSKSRSICEPNPEYRFLRSENQGRLMLP